MSAKPQDFRTPHRAAPRHDSLKHAAQLARMLALLVLFAAGAAVVAHAQCPPVAPAVSVFPCEIRLVGSAAGVPDPRGTFTITLNDATGAPCPLGVPVCIDFNACLGPAGQPDIRVCTAQPQGQTVGDVPLGIVCTGTVPGVVCGTTNAAGSITWTLIGGARNSGNAPGAGFRCATVWAAGVVLPGVTINVGAFDENGVGGVNPVDLSAWLSDVFSGIYRGRSDYDCTNAITPVDLSLLLGVSLGGGSTTSCGTYCF
jgi:hypothetical protein